MLVTPRPGVNRDNLLKALQYVHTEVFNLRGGGGQAQNAYERLMAYLEWTNSAVRMLSNQISKADLDHLVLTDRSRLLLSGAAGMTSTELPVQRMLNGLVSRELDARVTDFDAAIQSLRDQIDRWSGYGCYVMPDTSFYIHHPTKLEGIDLVALTGVHHTEFVVLVPMVIVDELDRLKESKDRQTRWRAGYTLAVLDRLFADGVGRAKLQESGDQAPGPDGSTPSDVGLELLFDAPGHVRLPNSDDEIIDRALSVEPLAARPVTLLTYDTGQSTRARNAGLAVIKLSHEIAEKPPRAE